MGEIADDMVEGFCCALCGVYFEDAHGYPVYCKGCWKSSAPKEREGHQEAHLKEIS